MKSHVKIFTAKHVLTIAIGQTSKMELPRATYTYNFRLINVKLYLYGFVINTMENELLIAQNMSSTKVVVRIRRKKMSTNG